MKERSYSGTNQKRCCSAGAELGVWLPFWRKLEDVVLLELNLDGGIFFGRNSFSNNADYDKEFIHYYCCIGECCSTGTEAEAWRFFWRKLEDVGLLELNLKHGAFFLMGEIYLKLKDVPILQLNLKHRSSSVMGWKLMRAVVEEIGGCCSTGAVSKTIDASYDSGTRYYCCCFEGCCSTGIDSEALRLFWKKLENVPILQLNLKQRSS
uniref:Uncharacterized protein n=1 Tax=Strongyloides stercoralis TaxID=6248 RepID=A0AAF5HYV3_STRER